MNQLPGTDETAQTLTENQTNGETGRLRKTSMRRRANASSQNGNCKTLESAAVLESDHESKIRENPYPCFNDVLIRLAILVKDIYVDQMNGRVYNRNGKEIPQRKANGHMIISLPGLNGKITLKVHRVIYISAHMNELLPCRYDVHHIDKNPYNNCIFNLEALPMEVHSRKEAMLKLVQHSGEYAKLTGTEWSQCKVTKDLVLALRVCIKYGGITSCMKKGLIYKYFHEKMCISTDYAQKIATSLRGNKFAGEPTSEDKEYYLKEYAWLLNAVKAGNFYEQIKEMFPDKFDKGEPKKAEEAKC